MVIDCGIVLKTLDGRDLIDNGSEGEVVPLILGRVIANAMMAPAKDDSGVVKIKKYDIAMRAYKGEKTPFEVDEVATIKSAIMSGYGPLIVGQVDKLLG